MVTISVDKKCKKYECSPCAKATPYTNQHVSNTVLRGLLLFSFLALLDSLSDEAANIAEVKIQSEVFL